MAEPIRDTASISHELSARSRKKKGPAIEETFDIIPLPHRAQTPGHTDYVTVGSFTISSPKHLIASYSSTLVHNLCRK